MVDFEETMDRAPEAHALYARLVATLVRKEELRPADRFAIARVIEHAFSGGLRRIHLTAGL